MTFKAAWSFENESGAQMQADMGWSFSLSTVTGNVIQDSAIVYDYAAFPGTRWSLCLQRNNQAHPPYPFQPGTGGAGKGCWAMPCKMEVPSPGYLMLVHQGIGRGQSTYLRVQSLNTMALYIGDAFQGTSQAMDLTLWHYFCLKSDMTAGTWTGSMWIDGVQEVSGTSVEAVQTVSQFYFNGCGNEVPGQPNTAIESSHFGGLSYWDDDADAAHIPYFYTSGFPTEDVSETPAASWVSTNGDTDNYSQVTADPLDTATNTSLASPATGNRVVLGIKGAGSDDIATILGITPTVIAGVSVHTWSSGESIDAKAIVGDGTNETVGSVVTIAAADTTYAHAGAAQKPTGPAAWVGADQPELIYEID